MHDRWAAFIQSGLPANVHVVSAAELRQVDSQEIARLVERGALEPVQRGVYAITAFGGAALNAIGRVQELQRRLPQAVLCMTSAASYLRLTTSEPGEIDLAQHRETTGRKPAAQGAAFHWMTTPVYQFGQMVDDSYGPPVRLYTAAKTVADLCRRRNKIGMDVYLGVLKAYLQRGGEHGEQGATLPLLEAARICGVERTIRRDLAVLYG